METDLLIRGRTVLLRQTYTLNKEKMAKTKFVIVGGVAGGATAAARMRRLSEEAEIVLFEKGEYISYANCGLPYYIGGVIEERDKLFVQTPEAFGKRFNIDVRTNSEVTAIDTEQRQVTVKTIDGKTSIQNATTSSCSHPEPHRSCPHSLAYRAKASLR